jgi:hypothetical protein
MPPTVDVETRVEEVVGEVLEKATAAASSSKRLASHRICWRTSAEACSKTSRSSELVQGGGDSSGRDKARLQTSAGPTRGFGT